MMADEVSVRELRQNLARYLERAHDGETFTITRVGRHDATLGPCEKETDDDD
jgi:prevent-host-death family protein